jgi:streptogramin lyase
MAVSRIISVVAVVALVIAAGAVYLLRSQAGASTTSYGGCFSGVGKGTSIQLQAIQFGAVKEYALPSPIRWSNAITSASDGSVWFGEEAIPGVAHLFQNGSLVEYPWPSTRIPSSLGCDYKTGIWGLMVWDGKVWGTDSDGSSITGVNPATGESTIINVSRSAPEPYTLALAPDGSMWFTSLSSGAKLGRISTELNVTVYPVSGLNGESPIQVQFVNASLAYFVALDPVKPYGHLYSFDPSEVETAINPVRLGGSFNILDPTSLSVEGRIIWVAQHGASSVAAYNTKTENWTTYPTSTVSYIYTTLPYFVNAVGNQVWFNEHYANRIGFVNSTAGTLTEYSEANPPVTNGNAIQNDLTITPGNDGGLWFTSTTGNYVGFVNQTYPVAFSLRLDGSDSADLPIGRRLVLNMSVTGTWSRSLIVNASDSENYSSVPHFIQISPSVTTISPGNGPRRIQETITATPGLPRGEYSIAITVGDGLVEQSVYVFVTAS